MKTETILFRSAKNVSIALFVYIIVLTWSNSILGNAPTLNPVVQVLVGISPIVPVGFILYAIVQLLKHSDELQQRIQLLSIGFSAAATGLLTFAYGGLELNGYPPLPSMFILPVMVLLWVVGVFYFKQRFQ